MLGREDSVKTFVGFYTKLCKTQNDHCWSNIIQFGIYYALYQLRGLVYGICSNPREQTLLYPCPVWSKEIAQGFFFEGTVKHEIAYAICSRYVNNFGEIDNIRLTT